MIYKHESELFFWHVTEVSITSAAWLTVNLCTDQFHSWYMWHIFPKSWKACGSIAVTYVRIVRENPRYSVGISSVKKGSEISHFLAEGRAIDITNHNSLHSFTNNTQTKLESQMFTDNATHLFFSDHGSSYSLFFYIVVQ
jgi:hypothetical protein